MWPFHTHEWEIRTGSGFGRASKLRKCETCKQIETMLYDVSLGEEVWVEGNFLESIDSPIYIIAETQESLKEALLLKPKGTAYYPIRTISDFDIMRLFRCPKFILARDWKDTDVSDLDDFRVFLMTGHF